MKVPWGLQKSKDMMVRVDDVPNGKASGCVCSACLAVLVAKNQGVRKAHHFAHAATADNQGACEGWLHATAKRLLFERIQRALTEGARIPIQWQCSYCPCRNSGDLLKGATAVHLETMPPGANVRPDILLTKDAQPWALVEIVHTHNPEISVHNYAMASRNPLVTFSVNAPEDIDNQILAPILNPKIDHLYQCPCGWCPQCKKAPRCQEYHRYCKQCQRCVEDVRDHGGYGAHGHCNLCGKVLEGLANNYGSHYCCYVQKRYGLPPCPEREHHHCDRCGKLTGWRVYGWDFWDTCYSCHQRGSGWRLPRPLDFNQELKEEISPNGHKP